MAAKVYLPTESDMEILREMAHAYFRDMSNSQQRPSPGKVDHEEGMAPEVYVARVPAGGIPALVTGTDDDADPDAPGFADCDVYRVILAGGDPDFPTMYQVGTYQVRVHNLSPVAVAASAKWVLAERDKHGIWWAVAGGGSDDTFLVLLTKKCHYYGIPGDDELSDCPCLDDADCDGTTGPKRFIQYSWVSVADAGADTGAPCPVRYTIDGTSRCGCPKCLPAYHPRNLDLPTFQAEDRCCGTVGASTTGTGTGTGDAGTVVLPYAASHSVVRLRRGAGNYYMIEDAHPWIDFWRRTGLFDDDGLEIIYLRYYDQNTGGWVDGEEGRLVNAG